MDNRSTKEAEKTTKYSLLRWELKQQYPGYDVKHFNIVIDVLGGWLVDIEETERACWIAIQIGAEADAESDSVTQFAHCSYF